MFIVAYAIYIEPKVATFLFHPSPTLIDQYKMELTVGAFDADNQTHSSSSSSSSIDSCNHSSATVRPASSSSSNVCRNYSSIKTDLSTDLRLGLSISTSSPSSSSNPREQTLDWPPIKSTLRSTLVGKNSQLSQQPFLFVKVYMEGIPIGRKLNLLAYHSYDGLVRALGLMFKTTIICPNSQPLHSGSFHVLTYEDQEGDWMMVGDVPWEIFLNNVKRLKITRADRC